jgi:ribonucleotide reductase alpha subunit
MQVIKRNGNKIDFNPNKILTRIKKQSEGLKVNADDVFIKVTQGIADDMTTNELDDLISVVAESLAMNHPDYSKLAANISITKLHKETEDSFMKATKKMYNAGLLNDNYYNKVKENIDLIESVIDYKKDYKFDYFGWCSLKDIYLLKLSDGSIIERPQQMYVRVALMITNTPEDFIEKYNDLSDHKESPATPIKINIGTKIGQIASCNLSIVPDDSTEGLLDMFGRISISSSKAEGIGLAISNIRSKESNVGNSNGKAGGILKYLKVVNEGSRFWNQRGKRPGSCAVYIEPWHKDIYDVLDIRKKTGDENLRARDLFSALWIPDNFMRAVQNNRSEEWRENIRLARRARQEREKLEKTLGSIADLTRLPAALFIVDIHKEHIAVAEAKRLGIPTFGIVDTNSNPNLIDYAIPANDDATKSVQLILNVITTAMQEGLSERKVDKEKETEEKEGSEIEIKAAKLLAEAEEEGRKPKRVSAEGAPKRARKA